MAVIIEMKSVSFSVRENRIVQDFSCQFEEGKTTAIIGPSGSGKSTVLKLSAGILVPTSGEVFFRDLEIFGMNRPQNLAFRRESSMVFQDSALWANQDIFQILELPLMTHFPDMPLKERKDRINEVLKEVGYKRDLHIRPDQLSRGEQKLVGFARAMICHPALLFLDEWTESLDDSASKRILQIVRNHQSKNYTVIFVSHDLRIIKSLADYVVMINDGQLSIKLSREQIEANENLAEFVERGISS